MEDLAQIGDDAVVVEREGAYQARPPRLNV
jgi:hypothetical protein